MTSHRVWEDRGEVLSYSRLRVKSEDRAEETALALVRVHGKGPKVACWSSDQLAPGDQVSVEELGKGRYRCSMAGGRSTDHHSGTGVSSDNEK